MECHKCELCGVPFSDDYIRAEVGRKRYCSARCGKKASYIRRRDKVLEELRVRRETDPTWREQQIQKDRDWREANRKEETGRKYRPR